MELLQYDDVLDAELASAWRRLEAAAPAPNLFMSHAWVTVWSRHFAGEKRPAILVGAEGGEPVGLAPLFVGEGDTAGFPVNFLSHRGEFVVGEEHAASFARAVLAHLGKLGVTPALRGMPRESLTYRHVSEVVREEGMRTQEAPSRVSPYVDITEPWDDYYGGRPRKVTHEWERKIRKLGRAGEVEVARFGEGTDIEWLVREFVAVEAESWKETEGTSISARGVEEFYHDLTRTLADEGWFRPFWLNLDGRMIGFIYGAAFRDTYFALKTSYMQTHSKLSPGIQLFREAVEDAFRSGLSRFDFVGQTSRWKEEWATGKLEHVDLRFYRSGLAGLADHLIDTQAKPLVRKLRQRGS